MSLELVESILLGDFVSSQELFEQKILEIQEKKLYEAKRMVAAMNEVVKPDPKRPGQFVGVNTKADWAKYRKQHKKMGFYDTPSGRVKPKVPDVSEKGAISAEGLKRRKAAGYLKAYPALKGLEFIKKVRRYKETGKLDETTGKFFQQQVEPELQKLKGATTTTTATFGNQKVGTSAKPDLIKGMSTAGKKEAEKIAMSKKVASMGDKPKVKSDVYDRMIAKRNKLRSRGEKTLGHLERSLKTAVTGKTSTGKSASRIHAIRRAGQLIGKTPIGKAAIRAAKFGGGVVSAVGSQLDPVT